MKVPTLILAISSALWLVSMNQVKAEDEVKSIIDKAIKANGGEDNLKKLNALFSKVKGTIHLSGMEIPFHGATYELDGTQSRTELHLDIANQQVALLIIYNKDKGWMKIGDQLTDFSKEQITEHANLAHAAHLAMLLPLREKPYKLAKVGDEKIDGADCVTLLVSKKDRRDVSLSFDKKTNLLVKMQTQVKDEMSAQEVAEERFFSDFSETAPKLPKKINIKRDGKPFLKMEIEEYKIDQTIDASQFAKP